MASFCTSNSTNAIDLSARINRNEKEQKDNVDRGSVWKVNEIMAWFQVLHHFSSCHWIDKRRLGLQIPCRYKYPSFNGGNNLGACAPNQSNNSKEKQPL